MKKSMFLVFFWVISLSFLQPAYAGLKEGETAYKHQDYVTALKELTPLAQQGDAKAQFYLGLMYAAGKEVAQDNKQAIVWYRKAAEQGHEQSIEALRVLDK